MVCNDAVLLDFSVVLREFLFQNAVLRFYKTKQFVEFSGNFKKVSSCLCYFVRCLNVFLWFCSIHTPLTLYTSLLLSGILSTKYGYVTHITVKKNRRVFYFVLRAAFSC